MISKAPIEDDILIETDTTLPRQLPFPPLTRRHILNCAVASWYPTFRLITPKTRLVPLTPPFLTYLAADGIFLPSDSPPDPADDDEEEDIAKDWRDVHEQVRAKITELGGKVVPKLNWSAPKDAAHMLGNEMTCYEAGDVYLLLKSSDFITFDLDHAFDDAVDEEAETEAEAEVPWHLALRKAFPMNPSQEFRCFVRERRLIGVSQRDMNYYAFLHTEKRETMEKIQDFFEQHLKRGFVDKNYAFDVFISQRDRKVWLIDINPWAKRTDPLLFSWLELLTMHIPAEMQEEFVRIPLANGDTPTQHSSDEDDYEDDSADELWEPELRLVHQNDPEARSFASPQYSAHKMPRDVVDAAAQGNDNALRELSTEWRDVLDRMQKADRAYAGSEDES